MDKTREENRIGFFWRRELVVETKTLSYFTCLPITKVEFYSFFKKLNIPKFAVVIITKAFGKQRRGIVPTTKANRS